MQDTPEFQVPYMVCVLLSLRLTLLVLTGIFYLLVKALLLVKTCQSTHPIEIPQCLEARFEAFSKRDNPIMAIDGAIVSGVT